MQSVLGSVFTFSIMIIMVTSTYEFRLKFYLTNSNNQAKEIDANKESIEAANFMLKKRTVVLIHEYAEDTNSHFNKIVTDALKECYDSNIITVDWTLYSKTANDSYMNVNLAGYEIGEIFHILCEDFNYSPKKIHIIGFGAGAHVAGVAARLFQRYKHGIIARITGLDPVGSFFSKDGYEQVVLGTDSARFVEVIHTSIQGESGDFGYEKPLGHLDFYPNGGSDMPGCEKSKLISEAVCSHRRSYKYLAEALRAEEDADLLFVGHKCEPYQKAIEKKCKNNNNIAIFGSGLKQKRSNGVYYFETNPKPPYAQG